jgi:hypothetical protein
LKINYKNKNKKMMHFGEPLTDSQAQEILTNLKVNNDKDTMEIDYDMLADALSNK